MNSYKDYFSRMAIQLSEIATEIAATGLLNIKPGTYTAAQIHTILKKRDIDYFERNQRIADTQATGSESEIDIIHRKYEVIEGPITWKFAGGNVFKLLKHAEKTAGIRKNAYRIDIPEGRRSVAETWIEFPTRDTMFNFSVGIQK